MNVLKKIVRNLNKVKGRIKRKFEMSDKEYYERMSKAREISKVRRRKQKLKEIRNEGKPEKKKKFEFSKLIVFFVFLMCMEILIFSQVLLWNTKDTSALYSLIAIPSTLVPTLVLYYGKAKMENGIKLSSIYCDASNAINSMEQTASSSSYSSAPTTTSEIYPNNTTSSESFNVSGGVG